MIEDLINNNFESDSTIGLFVCFIKKIKGYNTHKSFKTVNFTMLLIRSGSLKIEINDRIHEYGINDLIFLPKDTNCRILAIDELFQVCIMTFSWDYVIKENLIAQQKFFFQFLNSINCPGINLEDKDFKLMLRLFKLIELKSKNEGDSIYDKELSQHSVTLFLHEIRMIYNKYQNNDIIFCKTRKGLLVSQFLNQITIHCKEQHSVEFFANILCVTPAHLNKIVKKVTNRNAKDLISEALIGKAKVLLENPEITILEIAEELEFGTASSFSTFFKKRTAISPSEYRFQKINQINAIQ